MGRIVRFSNIIQLKESFFVLADLSGAYKIRPNFNLIVLQCHIAFLILRIELISRPQHLVINQSLFGESPENAGFLSVDIFRRNVFELIQFRLIDGFICQQVIGASDCGVDLILYIVG